MQLMPAHGRAVIKLEPMPEGISIPQGGLPTLKTGRLVTEDGLGDYVLFDSQDGVLVNHHDDQLVIVTGQSIIGGFIDEVPDNEKDTGESGEGPIGSIGTDDSP